MLPSAKCIWSAPARAIPGCSRCAAPNVFAAPMSCSTTTSPARNCCLAHAGGRARLPRPPRPRPADVASRNQRAMIRHAADGRTVVRLKGGDPTIFARLPKSWPRSKRPACRTKSCRASRPPKPPAATPASRSPIATTPRASPSSPARNRPRNGRRSRSTTRRWPSFPARSCSTWASRLRRSGAARSSNTAKRPNTPVAIVRRCSLPDQETIFTTLGERGATWYVEQKLRPPAVIIVGDVAGERRTTNWFTSRPLFGRTVLVTRPEHQADDLATQLAQPGCERARASRRSKSADPRDWSPVDAAIGRLAEFDWLVFSSSNGVEYFFRAALCIRPRCATFERCAAGRDRPGDGRRAGEYHLEGRRAAGRSLSRRSAGRSTRAACRAASAYSSRAPAAAAKCSPKCSRPPERWSSKPSSTKAATSQHADEEVARRARRRRIDWTTVTSSAIARSLVAMFGESLRKTRLAAISPLTAEVLAELGHPPAVVAETYTTDGLVDAILAARVAIKLDAWRNASRTHRLSQSRRV